jgi:NitT/TauT family transport system substrate-binding protein
LHGHGQCANLAHLFGRGTIVLYANTIERGHVGGRRLRSAADSARTDREGAAMTIHRKHRPARRLALAATLVLTTLTLFGGSASGSPSQSLTTITVNTLPIANGLPLDLGIQKGFFRDQGIEIKKVLLQSGNDIVLALANNSGDIGYIGYVPGMIGRTQGIPITVVAASDAENTGESDNWQNILVKGSSSIRTAADLAGKTVAVNALKGVGEVMIKAALKKRGVNPDSVKLTALSFPNMRSALANGQVDAVWTPEPFMSQILGDGGRIVLAPGPVLGKYFPIGCYAAREDWVQKNTALMRKFRTAINRSLTYAQSHPDEIRALLPAATRNIRLATWSPLIDRPQLLALARYSKEFGVISTLPNFTKFAPNFIEGGRTLQATVGAKSFISLRLDGAKVTALKAGKYNFAVTDSSTKDNFHLKGSGLDKSTSVKKKQTVTWTIRLKKGTYTFSSDGSSKRKGSFRVT